MIIVLVILFIYKNKIYNPNVYYNDKMPGPPGYSWKESSLIGYKFLIPNYWYLDEVVNNNEELFYVYEKPDNGSSNFVSGMVISIITNSKFPDIQSRLLVNNLIHDNKTIKIISSTINREGKTTIRQVQILFVDFSFPENDTRYQKEAYYVYKSRPDKSVLYVAHFESPSNQWEIEWKKGKIMIDNLTFFE